MKPDDALRSRWPDDSSSIFSLRLFLRFLRVTLFTHSFVYIKCHSRQIYIVISDPQVASFVHLYLIKFFLQNKISIWEGCRRIRFLFLYKRFSLLYLNLALLELRRKTSKFCLLVLKVVRLDGNFFVDELPETL